MLPLSDFAIVMSGMDNVAVAKRDIIQGSILSHDAVVLTVGEDIRKGHRFAIEQIPRGAAVVQYGYTFGISKGIERGGLVSRERVRDWRVDTAGLKALVSSFEPFVHPGAERYRSMSFSGFERVGGRVGTRNYYLVVPASLCASDLAVKLAGSLDSDERLKREYPAVDGILCAAHTEGCGCDDGRIIDRYLLTLVNTVAHPNVGGAIIVGLGCEKKSARDFKDIFGRIAKQKPIDYLFIQAEGGTGRALKKGRELILARLGEVNSAKREQVPLSSLIVGTECGASDSFSGITANPVIGSAVDAVISAGGSAILSEVPEMIGAEEALASRMASARVLEKFIRGMSYYRQLAAWLGVEMEGNFVEANARGGLINPTLKSLGAVLKGGRSEVVDFLDYSELAVKKGLSLMNGPGNDLESMTGIAAGGANIMLFSTGSGTTEGCLIAPVIKIPSRTELFEQMDEDMDFDAGRLLSTEATVGELADELVELIIQVASGRKTCAERWAKRSFQIWTAGKLSL